MIDRVDFECRVSECYVVWIWRKGGARAGRCVGVLCAIVPFLCISRIVLSIRISRRVRVCTCTSLDSSAEQPDPPGGTPLALAFRTALVDRLHLLCGEAQAHGNDGEHRRVVLGLHVPQ